MKKSTSLFLRLALVVLLLAMLYFGGASVYLLIFLGAFFLVFVLFREKLWAASEKLLHEKLPFMKGWPGWARWALVFVVFLAAYYALKFVVYSALALMGFDVQGEMLRALNATG